MQPLTDLLGRVVEYRDQQGFTTKKTYDLSAVT